MPAPGDLHCLPGHSRKQGKWLFGGAEVPDTSQNHIIIAFLFTTCWFLQAVGVWLGGEGGQGDTEGS